MAETHVIEIRAGRGEPALFELRAGVEVPPLSLGTGGTWKISASGMKAIHAYLYFDGDSLYLQSADPTSPMTADGRAVPTEWTPVDPPCTLTLGQAQLVFRSASSVDVADEEPTFAEPIPDPLSRNPTPPPPAPRARRQAPARPFKPGEFVSAPDDESTRLQPVGMDEGFLPPDSHDATRVEALQPKGGGRDVSVRPAAGVPWDRSATSPVRSAPDRAGGFPDEEGDPTVFGAPQPPVDAFVPRPFQPPPPGFVPPSSASPGPVDPAGLLNVPPPSLPRPATPDALGAKIKREWAVAPPLRKVLIAVFPLAFAGFLWVMFGGEPAAPSGVAAAPSSSASASPPTPPQHQTSAVQDPGALPVIPSPSSEATAGRAGAATTPLPTGPDAGQATSDRRERQAADYVATHAYDQAIRIYDQLAIERPQNPAFKEAARILRQKLDSGTP